MYTSKMRATDLPLTEKNNGSHYDYSMELKDFEVGDTSYIFFVAADGVTNMAITNPILCLS